MTLAVVVECTAVSFSRWGNRGALTLCLSNERVVRISGHRLRAPSLTYVVICLAGGLKAVSSHNSLGMRVRCSYRTIDYTRKETHFVAVWFVARFTSSVFPIRTGFYLTCTVTLTVLSLSDGKLLVHMFF